MTKILFCLGFFLLSVFVVFGDDDPPYDEQACFSRERLMNASSYAEGCEWIKDINLADFEKHKDHIYECYGNRFKFILEDGSFDVAKSLEAYDAFAVPEKKEAIVKAFNDCNVGGGPTIPHDPKEPFMHCFRAELAKICPVSVE